MNETSDQSATAVAIAERELTRLSGQVEAMRSVLVRLLQDVVLAESRLDNSQATQLLEANERLVVTALSAQSEADTAAQALDDAARARGLDPLTELPNRALLLDRLAQAIAHAKRHGTRVALLFLDLDDFKQINDTHGHAVGDEALKLAARCLASSVRETDTVSRHGGDEFLILLAEVARAEDAALIAEKAITALAASGGVGDHAVRLSASIGISLYPDDGEDADTLIDRADAAMYVAKRHDIGGYAFHADQLAGARGRRATLPESPQQRMADYELALAEHERRHAQLQEANENLVLAAISARELQAAAERAQQRQAEFMAVVAHELSNPMAPIRIATAMLGRRSSDEPLLPRVRAIVERQVAHMSRLVGAPLDMARSPTGALRLDRRTVDMKTIIDGAADACRPAMAARTQHFELRVPAGKLQVHGDPGCLAQVLDNLLDNASQFTPAGGRIALSAEVAGDSLVIAVADDGIGISAQALPNVFEPFLQDTHAIGLRGAGLGIGLTVVRELVESHGGTVVATSAGRNLGSQFVVTLPLRRMPAPRQP